MNTFPATAMVHQQDLANNFLPDIYWNPATTILKWLTASNAESKAV